MNIGVVTVLNSYNFGSYLQAKCLEHELEKYGQVYFLDVHSRKSFIPFLFVIRNCFKTNRNLHAIKDALHETIDYINLRKCWRKMKSLNIRRYNRVIDITVLGSDEMWNVSKEKNRCDYYFGIGIDNDRIISYGPSINNAEAKDFTAEQIRSLKFLYRISVRDEYSRKVLHEMTNRNIDITLDPTFLSPCKSKDVTNIIACYLFDGRLTKEEKEGIIKFAQDNNLKLVAIGHSISWCDESLKTIDGNPFTYYSCARYVITNTFHGTAFAINYNKQFISFANNSTKIKELLCQFKLEDRIVTDIKDISQKLNNPIDYVSINKTLEKYCELSRKYLDEAIETREV